MGAGTVKSRDTGVGGNPVPAAFPAPVGTMNVTSRIVDILEVLKWAKVQADEDAGIPTYTYGMNVGGSARRTVSGFTGQSSRSQCPCVKHHMDFPIWRHSGAEGLALGFKGQPLYSLLPCAEWRLNRRKRFEEKTRR